MHILIFVNGRIFGIGFRSKYQLPLLMIWEEWWNDKHEVEYAEIKYSTR